MKFITQDFLSKSVFVRKNSYQH